MAEFAFDEAFESLRNFAHGYGRGVVARKWLGYQS